ncbi:MULTISPECIES: hypothetical protein [Pseudonocardiaceae]|nr:MULTISPECIES: hypothetical protein [Pseudonocardiaceae]
MTDRTLHPIAVLCLLECYEYQASGTIVGHQARRTIGHVAYARRC